MRSTALTAKRICAGQWRLCRPAWISCFAIVFFVASGCGKSASPPSANPARQTSKPAAKDKAVPDPVEPRPIEMPKAAPVEKSAATHTPPVEKVYRPSSPPRKLDEQKLAARGVHLYESPHLRLVTDIAPEHAKKLPPLIDAAYD